MRIVSVDQFEFDNPTTEESLEIAIARKGDFPFLEVMAFIRTRAPLTKPDIPVEPVSFDEKLGYGMVREYAKRFAGISIPTPCDWPTYVLQDGPDEWELIICASDHFIHYRWATTG
jgi:hypothetical protein